MAEIWRWVRFLESSVIGVIAMKNSCLFILIVTFLAAPTVGQAVPVQSTTSTYVSLRNCIAGESKCDSIGPSHRHAVGGVPGSRHAQANLNDPEFGEAAGSADLKGEPGTAELTSSVTSLPARRNANSSFVLQRYTNTSKGTQTLTVSGDVRYDQTVPEENSTFPADGGGRSGTFVEMELFSLEIDSIEAGTSAEDNFGILDGEPPPGYRSLDNAKTDGIIADPTGQGKENLSVSAVLQPGDSVWLFAIVQTVAANGAVVEAKLDTTLTIRSE